MKTSRLAAPANPCAGSRRRAFVPAVRVGIPSLDATSSRWLHCAAVAVLSAASLVAPASAVNLTWDPNPENDIARYELSYGTSPGVHPNTINVGLNTTASVSGLQQGVTYYFVVTATNQDGQQSAPSAELTYQEPGGGSVPLPPPLPTIPVLSNAGWSLKFVSSQETEDEDGRAVNAFDGDPSTIWHSRFLSNSAPPPHELQIDLGTVQAIQGFRYLPRQDAYYHGTIGQYEFYVSMDGVSWGTPVSAGTFADNKLEKEVFFDSKSGRYIRFVALTDLNGGTVASVAELTLLEGTAGEVPENQAPVAAAQAVTVNEDVVRQITLSASDPDGDSLTYSVVSGPTKGSLSGTAPNLTYAPNANYSGTDSFTFRANDGAANSNTATVSITVAPVNDAPVAVATAVITAEDVPVPVVLSASDPDGDPLTYTIVSGPAKGLLAGTAPNLSYTPNADSNGSDSFTFRVRDGAANSNTATVSITVAPVNDAPVAVSRSASTAENAAVSIVLSASDKDGDSLSYTIVSGPSNGALSGTAPNLTYTPRGGFSGSDSFTFRARDGAVNSNAATVSITVTPVDDAPVAFPASVTTAEDVSVAIVLTASNADGGSLVYSVVGGPSQGALSGTAPNLTYTPNPDFNGSDSFTFRANDGAANSNTATISITVTPVNDAPVAASMSVKTSANTPVSVVVAAFDKEGSPLSYAIVAGPADGVLSGSAPDLTYTPAAGFSGTDSFTYRASDGTADSSLATISITVDAVIAPPPPPPNAAPVFAANPIVSECAEDEPMTGRLEAFDPDGSGALVFAKLSGPSWLTVSPGGLLGGMPLNQDVGVNSFTVRVSDSSNLSATANLIVVVSNTNDAPVFTVSPITRAAGSEEVPYDGGSLTETATDADAGDFISYSKVSGPEWLAVSLAGGLSGTPPAGSAGLNTFTVRATDRAGAFAEAVLQISIGSSGLPLPWQVEDLGKTGLTNRATWASDSFTLEGSGQFSGSSDSGCYLWQTASGDCTITARLVSPGDGVLQSQAGVMIRDSLAPNSQHVFVGMNGRGTVSWLRRSSTGGSTSVTSVRSAGSPPNVWLCLVRSGRTVSAYQSSNGSRWSRVGSMTTRIGQNCYIGLAVASGGTSTRAATFRDVFVKP